MSVAYDASSESHTGTTPSSSEASFSWTHTPSGTPKGVLVLVMCLGTPADLSTGVTYGGVTVPTDAAWFAQDTLNEGGSCRAYYLGTGVPTGAQTVVVSRTNKVDHVYAVAITVTAAGDTEVHTPGVVLLEEDGTVAEQSVTDGSPGTDSVRFAGGSFGHAAMPAAGANSTAVHDIDIGIRVAGVVRETTAGQGSRSVGFSDGTSDDRAAVHLAVREIPNRRALVSWAELEVPAVSRRGIVGWAELEVPNAPRRAIVGWAELEVPLAPRRGIIGWAELEVPLETRRAVVGWAELEVPFPPRRAIVGWAELEVPSADRRALVGWAEIEVPFPPRRGIIGWAELEVPSVDRRAQVSWAELEVPVYDRRGLVAWAELEVPSSTTTDRRAIIGWAVLETPLVGAYSSFTVSLANFLANGWRIRGDTQGSGFPNTTPASADPAALGGWWKSLLGDPYLAGHVLFFWFDDPTGGGVWPPRYVLGPWVRSTWIEYTFDGALYGWVAGQEVGVRVQTNWTLDTGSGNVFIEIQGAETRRVSGLTPSFSFWTIPVDGSNNQKDNYVVVTVPADLQVTVRMGGENIAPSANMACVFSEIEFGVYDVPAEPVPEEPATPPVPAPCSPMDILMRAQEETGYQWPAWTPALDQLERYAKQLLSRCMAAWYGNEKGDESLYKFDLSNVLTGTGWGYNWGRNWGGAVSTLASRHLVLPIAPPVEAVWHVEALPVGGTLYEPVNLVSPRDLYSAASPRCLVQDGTLVLLDFATDYAGVYEAVQLRVTQIHATTDIWTSIAPNDHIGPLFCRACELEMSRQLAHQRDDPLQAAWIKRELESVTASLMQQSISQRDNESVRTERR